MFFYHYKRPRNHCARIAKLEPADQPLTVCPPELDKKSRFYWRIGQRPKVMKINDILKFSCFNKKLFVEYQI